VTTTTEATIRFPYRRSLGPVMGAFMTALADQRIIGIRSGDRVIVPPREWDPDTGIELPLDFVDVGPAGTVETWSWVAKPTVQHPLDRPFAMALVKMDGADTAILHAVDAGSIDAMSTGMRVAPRWKTVRTGHITDLDAFIPGETPETNDGPSLDEPVTMMDYNATITYVTPVSANLVRYEQATGEGRMLGLRCPACQRVYTAGRSFCPIDTIELLPEHELDLPQTGVVTNYTIVTPTPYPGQTETEPFSRVHVLLDEVGIVLGYQSLVDTPPADVRIGMRVAAMWASPAERDPNDPMGNFVGWIPTGEPDDTTPHLVNRIN
jgi:uncharacterized OB-fold protein